tara:strand:+ start:225 stop:1049 length:825 start_codon:yes stop_codon:yes gene_type:complete
MEIIVKINDGPSSTSYKDGDIVQAFTLDEIYFHHAQNKCNVKNFGFETDGSRTPDPLLIKFLERTKTYKFERVNSNYVKRTNLITSEEAILGKTANENGERIDPYQYITRRLKNKNHLIFRAANGFAYWYGESRSDIDIDAVWSDIETHSDHLKSEHTKFPFSDVEKRAFLAINTSGRSYTGDSFTRVELSGDTVHARQEIAFQDPPADIPEDYDPVVLARRKWFVPYWDLTAALGSSVDDLRNPNHMCDCRKEMDEREHIDILTYDKVETGVI